MRDTLEHGQGVEVLVGMGIAIGPSPLRELTRRNRVAHPLHEVDHHELCVGADPATDVGIDADSRDSLADQQDPVTRLELQVLQETLALLGARR